MAVARAVARRHPSRDRILHQWRAPVRDLLHNLCRFLARSQSAILYLKNNYRRSLCLLQISIERDRFLRRVVRHRRFDSGLDKQFK